MAQIPQIPQQVLEQMPPWFKNWWQEFNQKFILNNLFTKSDFTLQTKQTGIIMTNAAGTVTKRVRLNDAGNGLIYEDV